MSFLSAQWFFSDWQKLVIMKVKIVTVWECSLQWLTYRDTRPAGALQTFNNSRLAPICLSDYFPFYSVPRFIQFRLNHLLSFSGNALLSFPNVYFESVGIHFLFNIHYSLRGLLLLKYSLEQVSWLWSLPQYSRQVHVYFLKYKQCKCNLKYLPVDLYVK